MSEFKELATQHANRSQFLSDFPHDFNSEMSGFIAGAEHVKKDYEDKLRWIPVEEKEPPKDLILMKLSNGEIRLGHFLSKMSTSSGIFVNVTHFRHLFL